MWWIRDATAQVGLTKVEMADGWPQVGLPAVEGLGGWTQVGVTAGEMGVGWTQGRLTNVEKECWGDGGRISRRWSLPIRRSAYSWLLRNTT